MSYIENCPIRKFISSRLCEIRNLRGKSQYQVYCDTGVHIGRLESEKVNITVRQLHLLCVYYGTTLSDFFLPLNTLDIDESITPN
jgi:transcriptional regulator with XRE-family HTH domain